MTARKIRNKEINLKAENGPRFLTRPNHTILDVQTIGD
jgi:hypothetical protein